MWFSLLSCCVLACIALPTNAVDEPKIEILPNTDPLKVLEGGKLEITCRYSTKAEKPNPNSLIIKRLGDRQGDIANAVKLTNLGFDTHRSTSPGATQFDWTIITLKVSKSGSKLTIQDTGRYYCIYEDVYKFFQKDVDVFRVVSPSEVVYNETSSKLSCVPEFSTETTAKDYTLSWSKNGSQSLGDSLKDRYSLEGDMDQNLVISKPEWGDLGRYQCVFTFTPSQQTVTNYVDLIGPPKVNEKSFDPSKNYVQGDNLILKCPVTGYPFPTVSWLRDGVMLNAGDRVVINDEGSVLNGKLTIYSLEFSDKGTYKCMANSTYEGFQSAHATTIVRVKDRLAALWPFLGIVAEVIILCIIIFIYEKRRGKQMEDEADSPDYPANTQDHRTDEVRQRNVRT
ncbi:basigin-like isoform X2 [Pecten maximus]|uniref:basigin-like isoform X2 n=1 Tax=Pecten maximus TaxID=6579 RepID=UPI0014591246|nr:basigin-like isoform X2 [Pecten maximus]